MKKKDQKNWKIEISEEISHKVKWRTNENKYKQTNKKTIPGNSKPK